MVIDTSVVFDALVPSPATGQARALLAATSVLAAPDILEVEIAGAMTRAVRRGLVSSTFVPQARDAAARLFPVLDPTRPYLERAVALSLDLAHPLADCIFLACAEARADRLVTGDIRFANKLKETPHGRFIISLADWRA